MSNPKHFKQSVAYWCLADSDWEWSAQKIVETAQGLGMQGIELAPPEVYSLLQEHNLQCSLCANGMPGAPFMKGLNNMLHHEEIISRTRQSIDLASDYGFPNVIAFTGYKWRNVEEPTSGEISLELGFQNCVKGLSALASYASTKNVTICLEHLNSRDGTHHMKGHPGYQGDDVDYCAEIIRKTDSPSVRLLFDVYHVQVMHGDIIRRLRAHKDIIGHIHTAGCPGRNEFDDRQEIHYPGVIAALHEIGYEGYIGHEFIPTHEPTESLKSAVKLFNS